MTLLAPARPRTFAPPALLAISHGTSSPEGQRAVAGLVSAVAAFRRDLGVTGGFVDVQQPDVRATLEGLDSTRSAVIVPLLLSAGYHVHVDLRNSVRGAANRTATLGRALGPDDRLVALLERRLRAAGLRFNDRVVLACAGSSDPHAVDDCHEMGARLSSALGRPVTVGFISAAEPRLPAVVERERASARGSRVIVATYLLAPGYFADLAAAAGGDITTPPLLVADEPSATELVDLVLDRYRAGAREQALS
jgi:sirohydrochlorin ferrochelatase